MISRDNRFYNQLKLKKKQKKNKKHKHKHKHKHKERVKDLINMCKKMKQESKRRMSKKIYSG